MLKIKKLVLACGMTFGLMQPAMSESLKEVLDAALKFDSAFAAARAELESGLLEDDIAYSRLLPRISYSLAEGDSTFDRTFTNTANPSSNVTKTKTRNEVLQLRQPIYDPESWAAVKIGSLQSKIAIENFRLKAQDFYIRVMGSYLDVLFSNRQLELAIANQRFLEEQSERVQQEVKAGEASKIESLDARAKLDLAKAQRIDAELALDASLRRLESFTGKRITGLKTPSLNLKDVLPIDSDYSKWEAAALDRNPEIRGATLNVDIAKYEIDRQSAGHKPKLSLLVSRVDSLSDSISTINTDSKVDSTQLQLELPIFSGFATSNSIKKASFGLNRSNALLQQAKLEKSVELKKEFTAIQVGKRKMEAYELAEQSATLALQASQAGRKFGTSINTDVLNATQQVFITKRDLLRVQFDFLNNKLRLHAISGQLDRKLALELDKVLSGPEVSFDMVDSSSGGNSEGTMFRKLDVEPLIKPAAEQSPESFSRDAQPLVVPYFPSEEETGQPKAGETQPEKPQEAPVQPSVQSVDQNAAAGEVKSGKTNLTDTRVTVAQKARRQPYRP